MPVSACQFQSSNGVYHTVRSVQPFNRHLHDPHWQNEDEVAPILFGTKEGIRALVRRVEFPATKDPKDPTGPEP
jgi:hypothetical protein